MKALLSVSDKTGIVELAQGLAAHGFELISSGGTHKTLTDAGLDVVAVADVTGAAEMLDGRVKTLHPAIHGPILADRTKAQHLQSLEERGYEAIDLVVVNLYPFIETPGIETIDIGGPTLIRAAAKNHDSVAVVVDPNDYERVLTSYAQGFSATLRRELARKAFAHTAAYDAAIVTWFDKTAPQNQDTDTTAGTTLETNVASGVDQNVSRQLPETLHISLTRDEILRYGENPHQVGARYSFTHSKGWWESAKVLQGKAMSYLNVYDTEAAWQLVNSLSETEVCAAVIKHANPCGAAIGTSIEEAYRMAHSCDTISAFGGIVALNREVDEVTASAIAEVFTEVVVAPSFSEAARTIFAKKKNLRLVEASAPTGLELTLRTIDGGALVQSDDVVLADSSTWEVVTERQPTPQERQDLEFAWRVAAKVTSNCIVLSKDQTAVGIGAGQQNRRDAGVIAAEKAAGRAKGGACASDAFFPFKDGLEVAINAGATAVVQPGGSIRDGEVIEAANEAGLTMLFTSRRHFRH